MKAAVRKQMTLRGVAASACRALVLVAVILMLESDSAEGEVASWYGEELAGMPTASGEIFDPAGHTAASWAYPLGTELRVTYGDRSVVVRVNDRGPAAGLGRDLDLSRAAAEEIGLTEAGVDWVTVEVIG